MPPRVQSCRMAHLDRPYGDWPQAVTSIPGEAPRVALGLVRDLLALQMVGSG